MKNPLSNFLVLEWSGHPDSNRESRVPETRMLAVTPCPAHNQEYNFTLILSMLYKILLVDLGGVEPPLRQCE